MNGYRTWSFGYATAKHLDLGPWNYLRYYTHTQTHGSSRKMHFSIHLSMYQIQITTNICSCKTVLSRTLMVTLIPFSSLDKEESLACKITSPLKKKIGCFERRSFKFYFKNNQAYCWMWEFILQASDSSLSKEPHASMDHSLPLFIFFATN